MKPEARYHYRGQIERVRKNGRWCWYDGYSEGEAGSVLYPWMTKTEARADAKKKGKRSTFYRRGKPT